MHKFAFVRFKTVAGRDRILSRLADGIGNLLPFVAKYRTALRLSESALFFSAQSSDFLGLGKGVARWGASLSAFDGYCRIPYGSDGLAARLADMLPKTDWSTITDEISGEYGLGHFDHRDGSFTCVSDFTGLRPLFYLDHPDVFAVSNRQMFLNPLCLPQEHLDIDLGAVENLLAKGNILTDRSLIAGVRLLPPGHAIRSINKENWQITRAGRFIGTNRGEPLRSDYRRATDDIIGTLDWLAGRPKLRDQSIRFSLTGGEDSRMVLALGLNSQLWNRVEAFTYGVADHPDMLASIIVAQQAGVRHSTHIHKPVTGTDGIAHLWENMRAHAFRFEGAPGAWDGGSASAKTSRLDLTGLFAQSFKRVSAEHAEVDIVTRADGLNLLRNFQQPFDSLDILFPSAEKTDAEFCAQWLDGILHDGAELNDVPELFYSAFRTPWWAGAIASNITTLERVSPLASKIASEVAVKQSLADRRDHRFIFEAMLTSRPDLLEVPYLAKVWPLRFRALHPELKLPEACFDFQSKGTGTLPWQVVFAKQGGLAHMARFIADHSLEKIFSVLERRRFEALVADPAQIKTGSAVRAVVNLAEVLILMANKQVRKPDDITEHNLTGAAFDSNIPQVIQAWDPEQTMAAAQPATSSLSASGLSALA